MALLGFVQIQKTDFLSSKVFFDLFFAICVAGFMSNKKSQRMFIHAQQISACSVCLMIPQILTNELYECVRKMFENDIIHNATHISLK